MNLLNYPAEEKPPKVPFGELVSSGYIGEGETIYSENKKFRAKILSNATLVSEGINGSIHSVSAFPHVERLWILYAPYKFKGYETYFSLNSNIISS